MSNITPIVGRRLPNESDEAYEAYQTYRDMDPGVRSQVAVANALSKSRRLIATWSAKFGWVERVRNENQKINNQVDFIQENIELASAKRHLERAQRLQDIGMSELERLAKFSAEYEIPLIRPQDAIRLVDVGFKMERLVLGQSTENQDHMVTTKPLTKEETIQYHNLIMAKMVEEDDLDVDLSGS